MFLFGIVLVYYGGTNKLNIPLLSGLGLVISAGSLIDIPRFRFWILDIIYRKWGLTGAEIAEMEWTARNKDRLGFKWESRLSQILEIRMLAEKEKYAARERARNLVFLQKEEISCMFPVFHLLCKLNAGGRKEQEAFLTARYTKDVIPFVFEKDYSEVQVEDFYQHWCGQGLQERRKQMEILFKLTILEDGIRNNEWKLLMKIMDRLKFNKYYIDYFKKRYAPLRTEFDEYQRSSSSSANYSASYLKPYYAVLGLQEGASDDEIKRAYHELAMQHHPDRPHNADRIKECEAMMAKVNEAYEKVMG